MSQKSDTSNPFDPTGMVKTMRDAGMDAWSKMMIQLVNSEAYAQATATMLGSAAAIRISTVFTAVISGLWPAAAPRSRPGRISKPGWPPGLMSGTRYEF
jgi:hypothetical protein